MFDAVPSEVTVGEHVHLKVSLRKPNAFFAVTAWTECSERGKIKLQDRPSTARGARIPNFLTVGFSCSDDKSLVELSLSD